MSKLTVVTAAAVAALAAATAASAAALTKTGEIKSTDATKHELVLSSGDTFTLGDKVNVGKLKTGEKVAVTYEMKDGKMMATKIHPVK